MFLRGSTTDQIGLERKNMCTLRRAISEKKRLKMNQLHATRLIPRLAPQN